MSWDRVAGHTHIQRFLRQSVASGRVAHAYAFVGPEGVGKATMAKAFAQVLLCADGRSDDACGRCRMCHQFERAMHPDFHWVSPAGGAVRIEQVRALRQSLSLRAFEAMRKVAVIDQADLLTDQAQNALLKLLEEPPEGAVLIIVTSNEGALLSTVRSRCQIVRFKGLPKDVIIDQLKQIGIPEDRAALVAGLTEGRLAEALSVVEDNIVDKRDRVAEWMHELILGPYPLRSVITIAGQLERDKDQAEDFLKLVCIWLRDLLAVVEGIPQTIANLDAIQRLRAQGARVSGTGVAQAISAVLRARQRLRENSNFRLTIDAMLSEMQRSLLHDSSRGSQV